MFSRLPPRILDKISPCPNTGCWFYVGSWETGNGYGKIKWEGHDRVLHRVIWALCINGGMLPPDSLHLDHGCRIRCCCNPEHLELVTPKVNTRRGQAVLFRRKSEYHVDKRS
jgi:hypothetical protein